MKVRVNTKQLAALLGDATRLAGADSSIPLLAAAKLEATDGGLKIAATDLDTWYVARSDARTQRPGATLVIASKLLAILKQLQSDDVWLDEHEPQKLEVSAGAARFELPTFKADDFPSIPEVTGEEIVEIPLPDLRRAIAKSIYAAGDEESQTGTPFNALLFVLDHDQFSCAGTDGHRVAIVSIDLPGARYRSELLFSLPVLREIVRLKGEGAVLIRRDDHHVSFACGRREFVGRLLEGAFPDVRRIVRPESSKRVTVGRRALAEALGRMLALPPKKYASACPVTLVLAPDRLELSAKWEEMTAAESVPATYDGSPATVAANPAFLREYLLAADGDVVRLEIEDELDVIVLDQVGGRDLETIGLVMPMSTQDTKSKGGEDATAEAAVDRAVDALAEGDTKVSLTFGKGDEAVTVDATDKEALKEQMAGFVQRVIKGAASTAQ